MHTYSNKDVSNIDEESSDTHRKSKYKFRSRTKSEETKSSSQSLLSEIAQVQFYTTAIWYISNLLPEDTSLF